MITVQTLLDICLGIEDKTIPVFTGDWEGLFKDVDPEVAGHTVCAGNDGRHYKALILGRAESLLNYEPLSSPSSGS